MLDVRNLTKPAAGSSRCALTDPMPARHRRSPFVVLWRTFFQQFFTSQTVSSDDQLRQTIVWVLAFLLVPGIIMLVQVFFEYAGIVARAVRFQQFDRLDDTLLWIEFVFVTYSMVTLGFVAVFVWDALT